MSSESVEMYLVTIAMLGEAGLSGPVPLSRLAEDLSVQSVSANQMVRKLDEEGLLSYQPYKGVELTDKGQQKAQHILRLRRLWEVFFVENLGLSPTEADALACRMEHVTTDVVAERLSAFLGDPSVSPTGRSIPHEESKTSIGSGWPLTDLNVGQTAEILSIQTDAVTQSFLQSEGLEPGVHLTLKALSSSGARLLSIAEKNISLSAETAAAIQVAVPEVENVRVA